MVDPEISNCGIKNLLFLLVVDVLEKGDNHFFLELVLVLYIVFIGDRSYLMSPSILLREVPQHSKKHDLSISLPKLKRNNPTLQMNIILKFG